MSQDNLEAGWIEKSWAVFVTALAIGARYKCRRRERRGNEMRSTVKPNRCYRLPARNRGAKAERAEETGGYPNG